MSSQSRKGRPPTTVESKIKLSAIINPNFDEDELLFLRQLGLDYCYTWVSEEQTNYEFLARLKERVSNAGLMLYNAGNMNVGKSHKIHLGLPGRDEDIEKFARLLVKAVPRK
jgi:hypothetical protein